MATRLGEDIPVGVYRTLDDIAGLKIRLRIQRTTAVSVPVNESTESFATQGYELLPLQNGEKVSCSERTFSWQEKVFKEESPVNTESVNGDAEGTIPIFSYINTELLSVDDEKDLWLTARHLKVENSGKTIQKKTFYSEDVKTFQKPYFFKELVQTTNRKVPSYIIGQSMAIMAVLDADDSSEAEEVHLCYLTFDSNGVLTVVPDFSHKPYYIRSSRSETYNFILEHVSDFIKSSDAEQEKTFLKRIYQHHAESLAAIVGSEFELPQNKLKLCLMMGELVSAENFEADNIFINFHFQLPTGAVTKDEESLHGMTNFCKVKKKKDSNGTIAYFGSPLTLHLEADELIEMREVKLLVEVSSIDFWNVCRNEGYGYCLFSPVPGCQSVEIKTWKLLPETVLGRLRHFFIGGTPYLSNINYTGIPDSLQNPQLSKYGLRTETSGSVSVKFHTILQTS